MIIKEVSIIIPFFNEEKRVKRTIDAIKKFFRKKKSIRVEIIFVNDGSSDNTQVILESYLKELLLKNHSIKFYKLAFNQGKGYAIKYGVQKSKYKWILMCDFDLSIKFDQLLLWMKKNFIKSRDVAYFGSRAHPDSKSTKVFYRYWLGSLFSFLINLMFRFNIKDTQCGFKLFNRDYALKIFKKLRSYGYVFDIDLILLLKNNNIIINELPITCTHKFEGKLNIIKDGPLMLFELIKIKLKLNH
jgi:dolichyl-phosphate beta-glucosyltransferase